jgi:hypothetical protein
MRQTRGTGHRRDAGLAGLLAIGCLLFGASAASAAPVGQAVTADNGCQNNSTYIQRAVTSGTSYTVAAADVLTSFSTRAYALSGSSSARLIVFRPDPVTVGNYIVVAIGNVGAALPSSDPGADLTTAISPIPVLAGDILGVAFTGTSQALNCGQFSSDAGDAIASTPTAGLSVGQSVALAPDTNYRMSIAANLVPPATTASCDPALSAVGCWRFDEASGPTALDGSLLGNNGTYLGNPALGAPGAFGTAVTMDGVNDSVRVPDANSLDVGDSFSIEGWVKRSSDTKSQELFNKGGNGFQVTVMSAANGNQVWLRKANVTTIARSTAPVPADGHYHHVVVTKNGTGAGSTVIYVDGVAGTVILAPAQAIQNTAFPMTFGGAATTTANYDEFALFDSVLTGGQVSARFAAGTP